MVEDLLNEVDAEFEDTRISGMEDAVMESSKRAVAEHRQPYEGCRFCKLVEKLMNESGLDERDEGIYLYHLRTVHGLTV